MRTKEYLECVGAALKMFRESRGISIANVARRCGLTPRQIKNIEAGEEDYSMAEFVEYIYGCNLYMYFAPKSENKGNPHDPEDLVRGMAENNPKL